MSGAVFVIVIVMYGYIGRKKSKRERGQILRVFGMCFKFRKLQTLPSFLTLFPVPTAEITYTYIVI